MSKEATEGVVGLSDYQAVSNQFVEVQKNKDDPESTKAVIKRLISKVCIGLDFLEVH